MPRYLVLSADWLEREIRQADILREHAKATGKPIAIAAAGVRAEGLKEVLRHAVEARPSGTDPLTISLPSLPPAPGEETGPSCR